MARTGRLKMEGLSFYHVMNRITMKQRLIEEYGVKEMLLDSIRRAAEFSGVKIYAFAIMDNHYHILCEVGREEGSPEIPEEELLRRVAILKGERAAEDMAEQWKFWRNNNKAYKADDEIFRLRRRIGDLSEFVKTYTEMFSQRIRREKKYVGVLWQNRFKSVLIQDGSQFQTVLRYINNNPVRAKYTKTSQEYAWCTLGAHNLREQPLRAFAKQCKDNVESLKSAGDSPQISVAEGEYIAEITNAKILGNEEFVMKYGGKRPDCFGSRGVQVHKVAEGIYAAGGSRLGKSNRFAK